MRDLRGPPARHGRRASARVAEGVRERQAVADDQGDRDQDGLLGDRPLARAAGKREDRGHEQADKGDDEQCGVGAGDLPAERLRAVAQPADQHAGPEHEQQVADDRAGERRLHDLDEAGLQREEGDDQLGDVAEGRVEDAADLRPGQRPEALRGKADGPGQPEDPDRQRRRTGRCRPRRRRSRGRSRRS